MHVSTEQTILDVADAHLVVPMARMREARESLMLAINTAPFDRAAGLARAQTQLSPLAMLLGHLANVSADEQPAATGSLAELPIVARDLARGLQSSVSQSGLFYESHLARWIEGKLSLETLRLEPQARLSREAGNLDTAPTLAQRSPVAEDLAPLVRRQLEFIENPTIYWRGDLWPGQSASLEISAEQHDSQDPAGEPIAWTTHLRLQLPYLGGIGALITLHDNSAALRFEVKNAPTAKMIDEGRSDLSEALAAQGIRMEKFSVNTDVTE